MFDIFEQRLKKLSSNRGTSSNKHLTGLQLLINTEDVKYFDISEVSQQAYPVGTAT